MRTLIAASERATVRAISVSSMDNNVYLLTCRQTGAQILIDAADDAPSISRLVAVGAGDAPAGARLDVIVTTHRHWDHIRALSEVAAATGARLAAGEPDAAAIEEGAGVTGVRRLSHGEQIEAGAISLTAILIRGHTPGSIALALEEPGEPTHLFTGDCLFAGGVGNTWGDSARLASLLDDVKNRLFEAYPDSAIVHPGHGKGTTLGAERPQLAEWLRRSR